MIQPTLITPEEFAAGFQQARGKTGDGAKPFTDQPAPVPPPAPSRHWTARTDGLGSVRLAPRRGYGTEGLYVRAFKDGSLVVDDAMLEPAAATRLISLWSGEDRKEEFESAAGPTKTVVARWAVFRATGTRLRRAGDNRRPHDEPCFQLHVFDTARPTAEPLIGVSTTKREAVAKLKNLLVLRAAIV
jgi:hypothetical protein